MIFGLIEVAVAGLVWLFDLIIYNIGLIILKPFIWFFGINRD